MVEGVFPGGKYLYMADLRALAARIAPAAPAAILEGVHTPLVTAAWEEQLRSHPDREFVGYLLEGFQFGLRIGFDYAQPRGERVKSNMLSAKENPRVVEQYLKKECSLGRVIGPLRKGSLQVEVSRFGVIPKPHQPGRWRLIVDLSHPKNGSINWGIDPGLCSLAYRSVDDAVREIRDRGRGTLLAKLDIESAYRIIPVHPDDRQLLGMEWNGDLFVDTALPFGLRSSPKVFTAMADGLLWILGANGIRSAMHYLDDYLFFGDRGSKECEEALRLALRLCELLGIPVASHKLEGPAAGLTFLGILLDTVRFEIRLPEDKLVRLRALLSEWQGKKACTKRQLLSLIGHLQHACRVVQPGRSFLRRMIDLSMTTRELHHHIRLNIGFRSDLQWWSMFLADWYGVQMLACRSREHPFHTITSDASGGWGCGAFCTDGRWFQIRWPDSWAPLHITVKELLPIIVACAVWGKPWRGKTIKVRCDNAAVVTIVNKGRSKEPRAMHLMRCLFFFLARFNVFIVAEHIARRVNVAADSLSRGNLPLFRRQVPTAELSPTPVPEEVRQVLLAKGDWTSIN